MTSIHTLEIIIVLVFVYAIIVIGAMIWVMDNSIKLNREITALRKSIKK